MTEPTTSPEPEAFGEVGLGAPSSYFFVRGHPRSGTNWVGRLLNLHPRIACRGEFHFHELFRQATWITSQPHMAASRQPYRGIVMRGVRSIVRDCLREAGADKPGATILGDRTPGPVQDLLPGSRHLLMIRDGRDVLVSFTYHQLSGRGFRFREEPFASLMAPAMERFRANPSHFLEHPEELLSQERWVRAAARAWAARVKADLDAVRRINATSRRVMIVRYEALHADTSGQRDAIYRFLGADPAEAAPIESGADTTPGLAHESPGDYRRKGMPGDWKTYFLGDAPGWFDEEAAEAMRLVEQATTG